MLRELFIGFSASVGDIWEALKEQFFSTEIINSMSIDTISVLFIVIYCIENTASHVVDIH